MASPGGHPGAGLDAPGQVLSRYQDVRHHAVVLHRPQLAGAAKTREYLVGDHQPVMPVAKAADARHEFTAWNPVAAFRQARLDQNGRDVFSRHHVFRNVRVEIPEAIVGVLLLAHAARNVFGVREGRLQDTARPGLHVEIVVAAVGADHLRAQGLAVERRRETDDVAPPGMAQRQVHRGLDGLGSGDLEGEARQRPGRHQRRELLCQRYAQGMLPLETVAPVCLVHRLDDFRVTVAERISGPAVLEVDIAVVVEVPDVVPFGPADNELGRRHIAPGGRFFARGPVAQAIAQVGHAAGEQCPATIPWQIVCHKIICLSRQPEPHGLTKTAIIRSRFPAGRKRIAGRGCDTAGIPLKGLDFTVGSPFAQHRGLARARGAAERPDTIKWPGPAMRRHRVRSRGGALCSVSQPCR